MAPTLDMAPHVAGQGEKSPTDNPDMTAPVSMTAPGGMAAPGGEVSEDYSSSPGSFSSSSSECGGQPAVYYQPPYPYTTSYVPTMPTVTYIQQQQQPPVYYPSHGFTELVYTPPTAYPVGNPGNPAPAAQYSPRPYYQPCTVPEVANYPIPCTERAAPHEARGPLAVTIPGPTEAASTPVQSSPHRSVTTNMEVVWHSEFERLFRTFNDKHRWVLIPCLQAPDDRCHEFRDSAKVRFCCQQCGNGWTSMKGRVMFWFYLDNVTNMGFVYFRLYGQKCTKCESDEFAHALWYPAEVIKVVGNIYIYVGQTYYNTQASNIPLQISTARRSGKPRTQHNTKMCQACTEGICREASI